MGSLARQRCFSVLLIVAAVVGTVGWLCWLATRNKEVPFLVESGPAAWIVYPTPPNPSPYLDLEQTTVFRRTFLLEQVPETALVQVRAFTSCKVLVNQEPAGTMAADQDWKQLHTLDVSRLLKPGENELSVAVSNDEGPPALWLVLVAGEVSLVSDSNWQSSLDQATQLPARLASAPLEIRKGNLFETPERTSTAWQNRWRLLRVLALLVATLLLAGAAWQKRNTSPRLATLVLAGTLLLWSALFLNNLWTLVLPFGFDSASHLDYIQCLQQHHRFPLASESGKADQPPLYYLLAALTLGGCGLGPHDPTAGAVLRLLGLSIGLAQIVLVFASLRLLFPDHPGRWVVGVVVAACLPVQVYLCHHVTNTTLSALLMTASLYLCLRLLRQDQANTAGVPPEAGGCQPSGEPQPEGKEVEAAGRQPSGEPQPEGWRPAASGGAASAFLGLVRGAGRLPGAQRC